MRELYRSFEGKLSVDQQDGYILYSINDGALVEYNSLSVWQDQRSERAHIPAALLRPEDYGNSDKIGGLVVDCWFGNLPDGQIYFRGKWWTGKAIRAIQAKHNDNNWQRYV